MRVKFEDNIASDTIECWGITVVIPRKHLFGSCREERRKVISKKICEKLDEVLPKIERDLGEIFEIEVSLESAWIRYYVFRLRCFGDGIVKDYALNLLSPNSPIKSFKDYERTIDDVVSKFPRNVAKPMVILDDTILQEWVDGIPLSDFKDGDVIVDEEGAKRCIPLTVSLLYKLKKAGYVYTPWEDYEVMLRGDDIVLLDLTRFKRMDLKDEDFFEFYFGVPFTSPDAVKPNPDPSYRLYWRGVSEKDYFGTSREEYVRLFLLGVERVCERDEFEVIRKASKIFLSDCVGLR
ncbi:MAG: hypothetical protein DRP01_05855 [Archaeoglobales archaeon]|nr:MAG: hypothetical protein DRP01_05855 [Archaeoglobales archaeon]